MICDAIPVIIFSTEKKTSACLNRPGQNHFCARLVKITNVNPNKHIYGILPGIVGEINSPPKNKTANCKLIANSLAGPNNTFLSPMASAHNGCGIAQNAELYLEYGSYDLTLEKGSGPPANRQATSLAHYRFLSGNEENEGHDNKGCHNTDPGTNIVPAAVGAELSNQNGKQGFANQQE